METLYFSTIDDRGVATVTLNRPSIHNAFNDELIEGLTNEFIALANQKEIRLIILTGEGKSFCAGADLNWMKSMVDYSLEENKQDSLKLATLFEVINNCTKPVIGKVNGAALGGGVGLVAVCDYVIASTKAKFGLTEVLLGLVPAVISPYVIAKIGESHARSLFLSGEIFLAEDAMRRQLVHKVCPRDKLDESTEEVVRQFLKAGPLAATESKKLIQSVLEISKEHDFCEVQNYTCETIAKLRISTEGQEGMNALLEKRKASWLQ